MHSIIMLCRKKSIIFQSNAPIYVQIYVSDCKWGLGITPKTPCIIRHNSTILQIHLKFLHEWQCFHDNVLNAIQIQFPF